jgi:alkanesulfonate monooxygenase SsuD/methylene tetrahydromethanopterin reductase-like flavin-dependent oxidoreductase (luciferase family)
LTPPAVRRAARLADGFYGIGPIRPFVDQFKREVERRGGDPEAREIASALMYMHVTRDPERKWREALPHMAYQVNLFARWMAEAGLAGLSPVTSRSDLEANTCFIAKSSSASSRKTNSRACSHGRFPRGFRQNGVTSMSS